MTEPLVPGRSTLDARGSHRRLAAGIASAAALLLIALVLGYYFYFPAELGPKQPIPFSHQFHVNTKEISCVICHKGVFDTARAGVPTLETCMLCHKHIIVDYPPIRQLRETYERGGTIEWVRVNDLPEFVYFTHEMHLRRAIDCGWCHGDIKAMDRVYYKYRFRMGFCIECHRKNQGPIDCFTCHR